MASIRKFQVFRNDGTPFIGTVQNIKDHFTSSVVSGLELVDGELIDVRYKLTSEDTEIKSLLGVAYVNGGTTVITWTGGKETSIAQGNQTYATIQLGVTENPEGTWTITSTIKPESLQFASATANGVTTYTLQVKNNTSDTWINTNATFAVDQEKFVDSLSIVKGTWSGDTFTEDPSGNEEAIKLVYMIGGSAQTPIYIRIPQEIYMEAIVSGDVWVSDGTGSTTSGNTYIRLLNEAGEYVYVDVTTLVNVITSVTGETTLGGDGSYVAVVATTSNGAVTLSSELQHSTVTNTNDTLNATNGVLTEASVSVIENYIDNYNCGTFTISQS